MGSWEAWGHGGVRRVERTAGSEVMGSKVAEGSEIIGGYRGWGVMGHGGVWGDGVVEKSEVRPHSHPIDPTDPTATPLTPYPPH